MADSSIRQDLNPLQPSVYYRSEAENRLELEKTLGELLRVAGYGVVSDYLQKLASRADELASALRYSRVFEKYRQVDNSFGKTHLMVNFGLALGIMEKLSQPDGTDWVALSDLCDKVILCVSRLKNRPCGVISPETISVIELLTHDLHQMNLATGIAANKEIPRPSHSEDFTSVCWFGTQYTFTKGLQAQSVRVLWEAWEKGGHSVNQETIGRLAGSSAERFELAKVFRLPKSEGGGMHPAWGTMIQQATKGSYWLVELDKQPKRLFQKTILGATGCLPTSAECSK